MTSAALEAVEKLKDCPADDRWFWLDKIRRRIDALEDDQPRFGLVPDEVRELAKLREVLKAEAKNQ